MSYDILSKVGKEGRICSVTCERDDEGNPCFMAATQNDTRHFCDLTQAEQEMALRWLRYNIIPTSTPLENRTSYGMKHVLQSRTNIYMTNNQFKEAMLRCGFFPVNTDELNWIFCISKASPIFMEQADKKDGLPMLGDPMDYSEKDDQSAQWTADGGRWRCSRCGYHPSREEDWTEDDSVPLYRYCPDCGARMRV